VGEAGSRQASSREGRTLEITGDEQPKFYVYPDGEGWPLSVWASPDWPPTSYDMGGEGDGESSDWWL